MIRSFVIALLLLGTQARAEWSLGKLDGFTDADKAIAVQDIAYINQTVGTECYAKAILGGKFTEMHGKSNQQILDLAKVGYKLDLVLFTSWKFWSPVTSFVEPSDGAIHLSRKFWVASQAKLRAGTLVHEQFHRLGFTHFTKPWPPTVPYFAGDALVACIP